MGQKKISNLHIVTDIKTASGFDMVKEVELKSNNSNNNNNSYKFTSGYGVDAVLDAPSENTPFCEHGPTILFERYFVDKPPKRFFACSACRDRKQCAFFQWEDEKMTEGKTLVQKQTKKMLYKKRSVK